MDLWSKEYETWTELKTHFVRKIILKMRLKSSIIKKETNYNKQKGLNFTNTMQPYNKNIT